MNSTDPDIFDPPPSRRGSFLTLPLILLTGLLIYEGTHEPAFAAMAMCLKFGWEDFRTAHWLRRTDPERNRGRACWWLYLASGLWQTAVIGVAMVFLTVVLDHFFRAARQGPRAVLDLRALLHGAGFTILFGFIFSTFATLIALVYSWRHRVRPWLNGDVHIARRNQEWPPLYGHRNRVLVPVLSSAFIICTIILPATLAILADVLKGVIPRKLLWNMWWLGAIFCVFILLPTFVLFLQNLRRRNFFAEHPADCWGVEPLPDANDQADRRDFE